MSVRIGYVVIGRNEGERLKACISSLRRGNSAPIVYVDSGSTDDSLNVARSFGTHIVELDSSVPFTAARARNAGVKRLLEIADPKFVQFVDGDCTLDEYWPQLAMTYIDAHEDVAVACGRRRERFPDASVYNRLCDIEWDTPVGDVQCCGGDALMRLKAIEQVGFYNGWLIAGEEPELCVRLREKAWKIRRLDAEMTLHDAAMTSFSQWWKRSARAGHAYAEVSHLHRESVAAIWKRETRRALIWAAIAPVAVISSFTINPWALILLIAYPLQILRLYWSARQRLGIEAAPWAIFTVLGKFPETVGILRYQCGRLIGRRAGLVEYK